MLSSTILNLLIVLVKECHLAAATQGLRTLRHVLPLNNFISYIDWSKLVSE